MKKRRRQSKAESRSQSRATANFPGPFAVTRRALLQGSGAVVGSYATGAFSEDSKIKRWRVERDGDPTIISRQVFRVTYSSDAAPSEEFWTLPEIAFGEYARISVSPRPLSPREWMPSPAKIDQRITVAGLNLTGFERDFFNLLIDLRYRPNVDKPAVEMSLEGWIFGDAKLVARRETENWFSADPVATTLDGKIATKLIEAIFGDRARVVVKPELLLGFVMPGDKNAFAWRIASKAGEAQVFATPPFAETNEAGQNSGDLVTSSSVDISREAANLRPTASAAAGPQRVRLSDLAEPKTVAKFVQPKLHGPLALGAHTLPSSQTVYAEVHYPNIRDTGAAATSITRNFDSTVTLVIAGVEGELYATRSGGSLSEGPFRIEDGRIAVRGPRTGGVQKLAATFDLAAGRVSLRSRFGPLEIDAPEPKRTLPAPAQLAATEDTEEASSGPKAAASGQQNPFARAVTIQAENGALKSFATIARITTAAVALARDNGRSDPQKDYRVDLTFGDGVEALFYLHGLGDRAATRPAIGHIALGAGPSDQEARGDFGPSYSLPLENATLRLTRWRDLTSLCFRFAGLDLTLEDQRFMLRPRGLARQSTPVRVKGEPPDMTSAVADSRPLMVVELPPQHVAEEAFFAQRIARPQLPDFPLAALEAANPVLAGDVRTSFALLRSSYLSIDQRLGAAREDELAVKRKNLRTQIVSAIRSLPAGVAPEVESFIKFADAFEADPAATVLPKEQLAYVGPEFLDPQAREIAEQAANNPPSSSPLFDYLPEDPVSTAEKLGIAAAIADVTKNATPKPSDKDLAAKAEVEANKRRDARDPSYLLFKDDWGAYWPSLGSDLRASELGSSDEVKTFSGRTNLLKAIERFRSRGLDINTVNKLIGALDKAMNIVWGQVLKSLNLTDIEDPTPVARHFLSGPSRLAFRLNTDDVRDDLGGAMPLSADSLTNWSRHELVVVRRAQKLFKGYAEGTRRPAWDRLEDEDLANQLLAQGFTRGGWDPQLADDSKTPRQWPLGFLSTEQRLAEVASLSSAPPTLFQTSIELPFRLHLSPSQDGRFRTRRVTPPWVHKSAKVDGSPTRSTAEPLWTAEFETTSNSALRAIWSPDFRPEAFVRSSLAADCSKPILSDPDLARINRPPPHGPYAPWMLSRGLADCTIPFPPGANVPEAKALKFRTSLDAFDRHELVTLSSVHGLPVIGKLKDESGVRVGIDQRRPPNGFQVSTDKWSNNPTGWVDSLRQNDVYVPPPLDIEGLELQLSSLGGFLRVNAHFDPPASVLNGLGDSYFQALSVERWRHRIVLGRDISAEVVYKGYLFPIGQRAALVKITERRFEKVNGRAGPVAVLRQRMFLRIPNRPKTFGAFRQPDAGRRVPFTQLHVTTLTTPDIVDPYDNDSKAVGDGLHVGVFPSGRLDIEGGGTAFWPRVAKRKGSEVKFDFMIDGKVSTRLPFIFVDNGAANDSGSLKQITAYYTALSGEPTPANALQQRLPMDPPNPNLLPTPPDISMVTADIKGAKLTFAPESKAGDTQYETYQLAFAAEGLAAASLSRQASPADANYRPLKENASNFSSDPFLQGADQPPFYPAMRYAMIHVAQIERLTGAPIGPTMVAYDPSYAKAGFDPPVDPNDKNPAARAARLNPQDVFLSVIGTPPKLSFGSSGDRGGGVARPESDVLALSRLRGPLGVAQQDAKKQPFPDGRPSSSPDYDAPPAVAVWYEGSDARKGLQVANGDGSPALIPVAAGGGSDRQFALAQFNLNAKLLGIVTLGDLLEIVAGESIFPQLHELLEFGGDLAGATDEQIRENVLQPLSDGLRALKDKIDQIDTDIRNEDGLPSAVAQNIPDVSSLSVKEVYKDVYTNLVALLTSLDLALGNAAANNVGAAVTQADAYSAIYANGKAFLAALEKTVRDPATPLTLAAQNVVQGVEQNLKNKLASAVQDKLGVVITTDAPFDVKPLRTAARLALWNAFSSVVEIAFPPAPSSLGVAQDVFVKAVRDALGDVLQGPGDPAKDPLDVNAFQAALATRLQVQDKALLAIFPGDDVLALAQSATELCQGVDKAIAVRGSGLDAFTKALTPIGPPLLRTTKIIGVSDALVHASDTIAKACAQVTAVMDALAKAALPIGDQSKFSCVKNWKGLGQFPSPPPSDWKDCETPPTASIPQFPVAAAAYRALSASRTSLAKLTIPNGLLSQSGLSPVNPAYVGAVAAAYDAFIKSLNDGDLIAAVGSLQDQLQAYQASGATLASKACNSPADFLAYVHLLKSLFGARNTLVQIILPQTKAAWELIRAAVGNSFLGVLLGVNAAKFAPDPFGAPRSWDFSTAAQGGPSTELATIVVDIFGLTLPYVKSAIEALASVTLASEGRAALDDFKNKWKNLSSYLSAEAKDALPTSDAEFSGRLSEILKHIGSIKASIGSLVDEFNIWLNLSSDDKLTNPQPLSDKLNGFLSEFDANWQGTSNALGDLIGKFEEGLSALFPASNNNQTPWSEARLLNVLAHSNQLVLDALRDILKPVSVDIYKAISSLAAIFHAADDARGEIANEITQLTGLPAIALATLKKRVHAALTAPKSFDHDGPLDTAADWKIVWGDQAHDGDSLNLQYRALDNTAVAFNTPPLDGAKMLGELSMLANLLVGWDKSPTSIDYQPVGAGDPNAILVILNQSVGALQDILSDIVRGRVASIIDFDAVKREMERRLRQFVPTRQTLAYDLDVPLANFPNKSDKEAIFVPGDSHLTLRSRSTIDLLNLGAAPQIDTTGIVGPFAVNLLGGFMDIATLHFDGAKFGTETGGKLKANVVGVELGDAVQFLQQVSSFFSFGSNGFYLKILFDPPGIEAGYAMPPMGFALGVLGISNLSLNAGVLIPFTDAPAMFTVGLSSPEQPFLINATVYGGGGHLKLYASAQGIVGFEASFEAGAVVSFQVGPLQGQGRVTFGIFLRSFKVTDDNGNHHTASTIEGMVTAAGSASIAIFHVSAMLQVRAGQQADGSMAGTALFTFSFSVGLTHVDFRITARHNMGKGFQMNPNGGLLGSLEDEGHVYASSAPIILAQNGASDAPILPAVATRATLTSKVVCKGDNYKAYQAYFNPAELYVPDVWSYGLPGEH